MAEYLATGQYSHPTDEDRHRIMQTYYAMLEEQQTPEAVGKMKQFATYFTHGIPHGSRLRAAIYQLKDTRDIIDAVDVFFGSIAVAPMEEEPAVV